MKTLEEIVACFNEQAKEDRKGQHMADTSGEKEPGKSYWKLNESFEDLDNEVHSLTDVNLGYMGAYANGTCVVSGGKMIDVGDFIILDSTYHQTKKSIYK